eukprot:2946345-Pyramimonas_sp.AAC.1
MRLTALAGESFQMLLLDRARELAGAASVQAPRLAQKVSAGATASGEKGGEGACSLCRSQAHQYKTGNHRHPEHVNLPILLLRACTGALRARRPSPARAPLPSSSPPQNWRGSAGGGSLPPPRGAGRGGSRGRGRPPPPPQRLRRGPRGPPKSAPPPPAARHMRPPADHAADQPQDGRVYSPVGPMEYTCDCGGTPTPPPPPPTA